ncbi:MAG: phenylacetate--CoA ligase family protein [Chloroflexota bacterium]|nr:phenylacetate--CoA ligase family protein [Chloroflexota bacterium]
MSNIFTILRMLSTLRRLRPQEKWTREQIEIHQSRRLAALRAYAYQHSPFYQQFHAGQYDKPLRELPILTKKEMMGAFDGFVTDRRIRLAEVQQRLSQPADDLYLNRYLVNATSGSTGSPGIFLFNLQEWAAVLASFTRAYEFAGIHIDLAHHRKVAIVSSVTPFHMSYLVGSSLRSPWVSSLRLSAIEPVSKIVSQLNDWLPDTLVAYASMARVLAVEQIAGRLQIQPQRIFTSSEVLTEETRRLVELAWGKVLFNQYGATETGDIASECERHLGMHLFEDLLIVENVDSDNQPVPIGSYGEKLLVTVLFNRTQPLIRYQLSDSIRLSDRLCECGRTLRLVDGIQGRQEDVLHFPDESGKLVSVHPNVFHEVMDTISASGWQVIQEDTNGVRLLISGAPRDPSVATQIEAALHHTLSEMGVDLPSIRVEWVEAIPRTANGKALLVVSNKVPRL